MTRQQPDTSPAALAARAVDELTSGVNEAARTSALVSIAVSLAAEPERVDEADPGPWHIVSRKTGRHHGPFSTEWDCHMARALAGHISVEWTNAVAMDRETFDRHLETSNVGGVLS